MSEPTFKLGDLIRWRDPQDNDGRGQEHFVVVWVWSDVNGDENLRLALVSGEEPPPLGEPLPSCPVFFRYYSRWFEKVER